MATSRSSKGCSARISYSLLFSRNGGAYFCTTGFLATSSIADALVYLVYVLLQATTGSLGGEISKEQEYYSRDESVQGHCQSIASQGK